MAAEVWAFSTEQDQVWHRVSNENRYAVLTICKRSYRKDIHGESHLVDRVWDRPADKRCKVCTDLSGGER